MKTIVKTFGVYGSPSLALFIYTYVGIPESHPYVCVIIHDYKIETCMSNFSHCTAIEAAAFFNSAFYPNKLII